MKHNTNIEELFREGLSSFEADPGSVTWSAIQSKMAAQQAAGTTVVAKSALSGVKIGIITGLASVVAGLAIGYSLWNTETDQNQKNETSLVVEQIQSDPIQPEVVINDQSSTVFIDETTASTKTVSKKKITVQLKPNPEANNSIVNSWLTPSNKKEKTTTVNTTINTNKTETGQTTTKGETSVNVKPDRVNVSMKEEVLDQTIPVAGIITDKFGGYAPLKINFSNYEKANSYEWNFGDGTIANDETVSHVFNEPGTYTISLTVKNSNGKKANDEITIVVKAPSSFSIGIPVNVISPDGNGINDQLSGKEMQIEANNITKFYIVIFDRKSNVVFESNDMDFVWDGKDKSGKTVASGEYFYQMIATGADGSEFKGKLHRLTVQ